MKTREINAQAVIDLVDLIEKFCPKVPTIKRSYSLGFFGMKPEKLHWKNLIELIENKRFDLHYSVSLIERCPADPAQKFKEIVWQVEYEFQKNPQWPAIMADIQQEKYNLSHPETPGSLIVLAIVCQHYHLTNPPQFLALCDEQLKKLPLPEKYHFTP